MLTSSMNIFFFNLCLKIIMHQSVKLTDAMWLLQLTISFPLIHAFGDLSQAYWDLNPGPQLERRMTYQYLNIICHFYFQASQILQDSVSAEPWECCWFGWSKYWWGCACAHLEGQWPGQPDVVPRTRRSH